MIMSTHLPIDIHIQQDQPSHQIYDQVERQIDILRSILNFFTYLLMELILQMDIDT